MNKDLTRTAVIALIFFGIGAVAAESNLNTFTLRADRVLVDYIGGNRTSDEVNVTGLIIRAGQVLGYYNESATDALLDDKANQSDLTTHVGNVTGNPHNVTVRFSEWDNFTYGNEFVATSAGFAVITYDESGNSCGFVGIIVDKDNNGTDVKTWYDGEHSCNNYAVVQASVTAPFNKGDGVTFVQGGSSGTYSARVYYFSIS